MRVKQWQAELLRSYLTAPLEYLPSALLLLSPLTGFEAQLLPIEPLIQPWPIGVKLSRIGHLEAFQAITRHPFTCQDQFPANPSLASHQCAWEALSCCPLTAFWHGLCSSSSGVNRENCLSLPFWQHTDIPVQSMGTGIPSAHPACWEESSPQMASVNYQPEQLQFPCLSQDWLSGSETCFHPLPVLQPGSSPHFGDKCHCPGRKLSLHAQAPIDDSCNAFRTN